MLNFNFVLLYVEDPAASAEFYSGLIGRPLIDSRPGFAMLPLSESVVLGLWGTAEVDLEGDPKPGASEISFDVADRATLEQCHSDWKAKGVTILSEPVDRPFGRTFVAADPDGHRIRVVAGTSA